LCSNSDPETVKATWFASLPLESCVLCFFQDRLVITHVFQSQMMMDQQLVPRMKW